MTETLGQALDDPRRAHFLLNHRVATFAVLQAVTRLGLLDMLDVPIGLADLASRAGVKETGLARVLSFLEAEGVLEIDAEGTIIPGPRTAALRDLAPAIGNDRLSVMAALEIDPALRDGRPAFEHRFGQPAFEYLRDHPEIGANFARLMQLTTRQTELGLLERHRFAPFTLAVDIGGNRGSLLLHLLSRNPEARGVLFDLPETVEAAQTGLAEVEAGARIKAVGGDFFAEVPAGGDLYLLKQILHDWDDEACLRILRNIRRGIAPEGRLCVIERLIPAEPGPHNARDLDVLMLLWTDGGRERTLEEYRAMLAEAGFAVSSVTLDHDGQNVIEATPA